MISLDTKNILFISGGAFDGIEKYISRRLNTRSIGFKSEDDLSIDSNNILQYVSARDLKSFGLIPELIGRMPVVTHVKHLDKIALRKILTEPKNALIKQYKKLFEMDGINLTFTRNSLDLIVEKSIELQLGARGLRSVCEAIMMDAMYEYPSEILKQKKDVKISTDYVESKLKKLSLKKLQAA
tara:strand:- start:146 stop:694 length:549 start_codon:yes stop_codon:yes gene_type:complete